MKHQGKLLGTEATCFVYICEIWGCPSRGGGVASSSKGEAGLESTGPNVVFCNHKPVQSSLLLHS